MIPLPKPKRTEQEILENLICVTTPEVQGAHDAEMVLVGDRAFIVAEVNDLSPGESVNRPEFYVTLSIVHLPTLRLEKVIPFAHSGQAFPSEQLRPGACFVPRILRKDQSTLRCFFSSEQPGVRQSQTYFRDFDLGRMEFGSDITRAKLKTRSGVFDMCPRAFYEDAVKSGFDRPHFDHSLYILDSFKKFDDRIFVTINNYKGKQNAFASLNEELDTFEILGHINDPAELEMSEATINRLPDGRWMAVCRCDAGDKNYRVATSKDGCNWSSAESVPFLSGGTNSKPTFDKFGGFYYLGWQESTQVDGAHRSVFNIDVSADGEHWTRRYHFASSSSFQYPSFHEQEGRIWLCVTQGDFSPSRKERIMFGLLEEL